MAFPRGVAGGPEPDGLYIGLELGVCIDPHAARILNPVSHGFVSTMDHILRFAFACRATPILQ